MTSSEVETAEKSPLINSTMILLIAYNLFYWLAPLSKPMNVIKDNLAQNWGLLTFLEFLAMASLVVDLTVRWDKFSQTEQRWRMAITFLIGASFFVRLVFGIIGLYIIGEAH